MSAPSSTRINANMRHRSDGVITCAHCGAELPGTPSDVFERLPRRETSPSGAGPHVCARPEVYIDAEVVFRQYYCPGCWTAFHTEIVPRSPGAPTR